MVSMGVRHLNIQLPKITPTFLCQAPKSAVPRWFCNSSSAAAVDVQSGGICKLGISAFPVTFSPLCSCLAGFWQAFGKLLASTCSLFLASSSMQTHAFGREVTPFFALGQQSNVEAEICKVALQSDFRRNGALILQTCDAVPCRKHMLPRWFGLPVSSRRLQLLHAWQEAGLAWSKAKGQISTR